MPWRVRVHSEAARRSDAGVRSARVRAVSARHGWATSSVLLVSLLALAPSAFPRLERLPRFAGCFASRAELRPRSIVVACGDGNFFLTGLRWSSWTTRRARAAGIGHQNLCTPNCASGQFRRYPIAAQLFRPVRCKRGGRLFTRLAWEFVRTKPPGVARTGTARFPFPNSFHCP